MHPLRDEGRQGDRAAARIKPTKNREFSAKSANYPPQSYVKTFYFTSVKKRHLQAKSGNGTMGPWRVAQLDRALGVIELCSGSGDTEVGHEGFWVQVLARHPISGGASYA